MPDRSHPTIQSKTIGCRIATARSRIGLSQARLAALLGVSPGAIAQYESGRNLPKAKRLDSLSKILEVSIEWLVGSDEKHNSPRTPESDATATNSPKPSENVVGKYEAVLCVEPQFQVLIAQRLQRIEESIDRIREDVRELRDRVGALEERYASVSRRLDQVEGRLERIERRLELSDQRT